MVAEIVPAKPEPDPVRATLALADTYGKLLNYARQLVKSSTATMANLKAEELVSDAVAKALKKSASYDPSLGSVVAWICGFITRIAMQRQTKAEQNRAKGSDVAVEGLISREPPPHASVETHSEWQRTRAAMNQLDATDRQLLEGYYYDELTSVILSQVTGLSRVNVRVRISRAIEEMKRMLDVRSEGQP